MRKLLPILALLCSAVSVAANDAPYASAGSCAGLPKLNLKTPDGFCVGLAAYGLKFPRDVLPLSNGSVLVVEMGSWAEHHGRLSLLTPATEGYQRRVVVEKLDRPHGIGLGPDGAVYIGEVGRIRRFALNADGGVPDAPALQTVIGAGVNLPAPPGKGRHPLTSFQFVGEELYVNVGSASDHCEGPKGSQLDPKKPCAEAEGEADAQGLLRHYRVNSRGQVSGGEIYARGLRNSMALAAHPNTGLWQGENSRDAINRANPKLEDAQLPHDELNHIQAGQHYGWPYCYDDNQAAPEYPQHDCARYQAPVRLLAPHAAPLGMSFYTAQAFPAEYQGNLLIGYHGYREQGHRLMALSFDEQGRPHGELRELISGWDKQSDQPMGAPVAVRVGVDGSVWLTEDRNGTLLRLNYLAK